jgi:hypothetical protein
LAILENNKKRQMKDYRVIQIERLIIDGDAKSALLQLSQLFEQFESDLANDALLYLGQWNSYERDATQGVIQRGGTEVARIQRATLSLKDEIQSILVSKGQVLTVPPVDQTPKKTVDRFTYILEDDFTNNDNGWLVQLPEEVGNEVTAKFYFDKKQYFIEGTVEDNNMYYSACLCVLDEDADFKIETTIECLNIEETAFFGLMWGGNTEMSGYHTFSLSSAGSICIDSKSPDSEEFISHLPWTFFAPVNEGIGTNVLSIEKDKQKLKFSVNGKLVHIHPYLPFHGNVIGYIIANKLKISIKNLRVGIA